MRKDNGGGYNRAVIGMGPVAKDSVVPRQISSYVRKATGLKSSSDTEMAVNEHCQQM